MKTKLFNAAVLEELNAPLKLRELEIPQVLFVGQVLVKISFSGICGKQLVEMSGALGPDKFMPHLLGHEGSGVVVATGPGVRRVKPGDSVVLHWRKGSGIESECPQYWCPELNRYVGGGWVTTFQEYSVVSENRLTKISPEIPKGIAALMGCAVTTGLGIIFNELQVKPGQSVVIFGSGGVGINVIQGAALAAAYPIIATDIYEHKVAQAFKFGATHTSMAHADFLEIELRKVLPEGADFVIDTTGQQQMVSVGMNICNSSGTFVLVGHLKGNQTITIDPKFVYSGKRITTSMGGSTEPNSDILRYLGLYKSGRVDLESLVSMTTTLPKINEAFSAIHSGNIIRSLIAM